MGKKGLLGKIADKISGKQEPLPKKDIEVQDVSATAPELPQSIGDVMRQEPQEHKASEASVAARANKNKYIEKLRTRGQGKGSSN